jgi:mono/diheme cytochrome c family protein
MRPQTFAAALAIALGSAACVGQLNTMGDDSTGDDTTTQSAARQMFENEVSPLLAANCAGCHAGAIDTQPLKYMGNTGAAGYYDGVVAEPSVVGGFDPGLANLVNKGPHDSGAAPGWDAAQEGIMTSWLLAEADERGIVNDPNPNPGNPTPTTSREALAQWSACMSIDDWLASNVASWADKGSERGQCVSCHNQGAGGFYASSDDNEMYEMNRYEIYITTFFTAAPVSVTDPSQGYQVLVNEQKLRLKANSVGHPSFNPDGGEQLQNLRDFYDLTMARKAAGLCPPGGFPEVPPAP